MCAHLLQRALIEINISPCGQAGASSLAVVEVLEKLVKEGELKTTLDVLASQR